jgi:acyl-CoA hydrolase
LNHLIDSSHFPEGQKISEDAYHHWEDFVVSPEDVLSYIKPGMNIFLGSGVAEPRTLMKCLIDPVHSKPFRFAVKRAGLP